MRQLTSLDAQFLAMEDGRTHGHVWGVAILDPATAPGGELNIAALRRHFAARLHLMPPLWWRLVPVPLGLDHPYWAEDAEVDLDYHLQEIVLPAPGDERRLAEQMARIAGRPLDRSRPLWESHLIHGLEGRRVALLTKIHHALVDGLSIAEITLALLDLAPEGREVPAADRVCGEQVPGQAEMLVRGLAGAVVQPLRALGAASRVLPHLDALASSRMLSGVRPAELARRLSPRQQDAGAEAPGDPRPRVPQTVFNGPVSAHRRVAFESLSLDEVRALKDHLGGTVNDVVMAVCAGALRSWLIAHDALPDAPLVAMVPVSTRKPEQWGTYGNRIGVMTVELPTDEPDLLRRYQRAREAMRTSKEGHRAGPETLLQDVSDLVPPVVFGRTTRAALRLVASPAVQSPFNVVISNVMGSPVPLYVAGARMEALYPFSTIAHGAGLNLMLQSYGDRIGVGVLADRDHITDAWQIADCLRDAHQKLLKLLPVSVLPVGK